MDTYEQKYKEALERAKQFSKHPYLEDSGGIVEYIFPELNESEDEKTKKAIIKHFNDYSKKENIVRYYGVDLDDIFAWLEKQGEQKPIWSEEDSLMISSIIDTLERLKGKGATDMKIDWLKNLRKRMEEQE